MRTIKFRGKRVDNGEWEEGFVIEYEYGTAILNINSLYHVDGAEWNFNDIQVIPETVGQFTGLTDKNGKDIWEGDILARCFEDYNENCEVYYHKGVLSARAIVSNVFRPLNTMDGYGWCRVDCGSHYYDFRVIGNIHDNPELL